jgi:hypothetical protein
VGACLRELATIHHRASLDLFSKVPDGIERPWTATRLEADCLVVVRLGLANRDSTVVQLALKIRERFGLLGYGPFAEFGTGVQTPR